MTDKLYIEAKEFHPKHIFENGQCFHWKKLAEDKYITVIGKAVVVAEYTPEGTVLSFDSSLICEEEIRKYFDMDCDYDSLKKRLIGDEVLAEAMNYGWGLRLLNQNHYETIISFIISANNNIKRIQNSVFAISKLAGEFICEYESEEYYAFPTPRDIANIPLEVLRSECGLGFRDAYVKEASRMICEGEFDVEAVNDMVLSEARKYLMTLPGVGPKVADCILLFSYGRKECFPVDVWVKRLMENLYLKREAKKSEIADAGAMFFGDIAGLAQQYIFYYGRDNNIGK